MHTTYVIRCVTAPGLYWQTRTGWVSAMHASEFELNDTKKYPLPPDGEWVRLENPSIPRRIA